MAPQQSTPAAARPAATALPHPRTPFHALGPDVFERILTHLAGESLETAAISTDAVRYILPFALTCTTHYTWTRLSIRRLSILPLHFSRFRRTNRNTARPLPFPSPPSPASTPPPRPLAKVSPRALERALLLYPNLRVLHLSLAVHVTDAALRTVATHLPHLRELRVPGNHHITVAGLAALTSACRQLAKLDLSYCSRLGDECAPVFREMPALCSLDVTYWRVSDAFVAVVAGLPRLEELAVSACGGLTEAACAFIGKRASGLRRLRFRCAPNLTDGGVRKLARCSSLEVVDLSLARNVSDEGVVGLGNPELMPALCRVLLSQCRLLSDCAVRSLTRNPSIRCLDLSFCELLTDAAAMALKALPLLEEVDLSECRNITDKGVRIVSTLPSLLRLRLTHCQHLTDGSADAICTAPNVPLQELDVRKCCGITADGLDKLRNASTRLRY